MQYRLVTPKVKPFKWNTTFVTQYSTLNRKGCLTVYVSETNHLGNLTHQQKKEMSLRAGDLRVEGPDVQRCTN